MASGRGCDIVAVWVDVHSNVTLNEEALLHKRYGMGPVPRTHPGVSAGWGSAHDHGLLVFCDAVAHQSFDVTSPLRDDDGERSVRKVQPCMDKTAGANHHGRSRSMLQLVQRTIIPGTKLRG